MDKQKEVKAIANEICNYVKSKDITSVAVVAKSPYLEHLHNTGIAEWLVERGYGDIKAAVKEFVDKLKKEYGNVYRCVSISFESLDYLVEEADDD